MSFSARRGRVIEGLPDDVPALFVTNPANIRYLTGFSGSNAQLLLAPESVFFTDGRYDEQSSEQVPDLRREIYSGTTKMSDLLSKALADRGLSKLGIEAAHLTVATKDKLSNELSGTDLVATTELVEKVRVRKDAAEIDAIRSAQRVAEEAVVGALADFTSGTELDLAMDLEWRIRKAGADGLSFDVIVAAGPHSALPHASPRREAFDKDGVLLIDIGARAAGYCSDMTRTYLGRKAPAEIVKAHEAVCAALHAGCAAVRPGTTCADVDRAARGVLEREGLGERFVHSTGHGVGLEIHEAPTLAPTAEGTLEAGMIVTIEPGVYLPGIGGVRVEDLLVVTDDGYENLTALPRGPELP